LSKERLQETEELLSGARPQVPDLTSEQSRAILQQALAEARRPAHRHLPFLMALPVRPAYALTAAVLVIVAIGAALLVGSRDASGRLHGGMAREQQHATEPGALFPPVQEQPPGSRVVDDLLLLNPVRMAAAGEADLSLAASAMAPPDVDPRLQQKVTIHAKGERIADLLAWLSKATEVTLTPRLEVADERVTIWATDRTLMDLMRDIRHFRGYFWSRSKRGGKLVYSLWQDAQSRAREEMELQRLRVEAQREFQEDVRRHVAALSASEEELARQAQDDPYFVAQMKHPVIRAGYELLAVLPSDQQAHLLQGQTPSRSLSAGEDLLFFKTENRPGDPFFDPPEFGGSFAPLGDVVTLRPQEMTPAQRAALKGIFQGAARHLKREVESGPEGLTDLNRVKLHVAEAADLDSTTVSLFRWGGPSWQGLSLRLDFQSEGRGWGLYSNLALPPDSQKFYNDMLRKGEFRMWPGAQEEINRYLAAGKGNGRSSAPAKRPSAVGPPDPILDAPISVTWPMALLRGEQWLPAGEILDRLHRAIGRTVVSDGLPGGIVPSKGREPVFRWEKRSLRELLDYFFPGSEIRMVGDAVLIQDPNGLRRRLDRLPPAVDAFLKAKKAPFSLDDMALLARSLSPWQIARLNASLPPRSIDQLLAARELLKLYGELAPSQRAALRSELPFARLTPVQQELLVACAQRYRPFLEPWRLQRGGLRLVQTAAPKRSEQLDGVRPAVARMLFQVRFEENDRQSFPLDLFPPRERLWDRRPVEWVGKPFPFPTYTFNYFRPGRPALLDPRVRKKALVMVMSWPYAAPFVGSRPPAGVAAWTTSLAEHLRGTGLPVVDFAIGRREETEAEGSRHPNLIRVSEPPGDNEQPFVNLPMGGKFLHASPTVFILDRDEVVRAVFEGPDAWDTAAIERAARAVSPVAPPVPSGPTLRRQ
jgi:hypothetical protein